jgi:hypothetical protein
MKNKARTFQNKKKKKKGCGDKVFWLEKRETQKKKKGNWHLRSTFCERFQGRIRHTRS